MEYFNTISTTSGYKAYSFIFFGWYLFLSTAFVVLFLLVPKIVDILVKN